MQRSIEVFVEFLPTERGGRRSAVGLGPGFKPHYSPHLRVTDGDESYLGVQFVDGPHRLIAPGESANARIQFLHEPQVSYASLKAGTTFEIMEGGKVVGSGRVTQS